METGHSDQVPFGFAQEFAPNPLDFDTLVVGPEVLAAFLGVSDRQVQKLSKEGAVETRGHGKYHLRNSVKLFIERQTRNAASSVPGADGDDLKTANLRIALATAETREIELAKVKEELVPADEIARAWEVILTELRSKLLNQVPRRLAALLKGETNETAAKDTIRREMVEALSHVSAMDVEEGEG